MHHNVSDPRRPQPLRRVDRYALLATLAEKPRGARLSWGRKRQLGHIRAWPRAGALSFRVDGGVGSGLGLPEENTDAELRFRVRGLSFRAEGRVRKVQREQGRLMLKPDAMEWRVRKVALEGRGKVSLTAHLTLKGPDGGTHNAAVIAIAREELRFVCWPCPRTLEGELKASARLYIEQDNALALTLGVHRALPVFSGSQGRIMVARVIEGSDRLQQFLQTPDVEARSVA